MRRSVTLGLVVAAIAMAAPGGLLRPAPAQAGIGSLACGILGKVGEGWWGSACNAVLSVGQKVLGSGKKAVGAIGSFASNPLVQRGLGIAAIVAWVLGGAKWTMDHMTSVISHSTSPTLTAGWFTGVYLRVEGLALFFTLLFICAAAAEAVLRSESAALARAVFGYLPLAALLTAIATPLAMLLLAATDELSAGLAQIAGQGTTRFLTGTSAWVAAGLTAADPFFAVLAGGLVVAAAGALWVEMLIREVAVYVVVAMLPVVFAAMVWPARRVLAIRAVEVLVALILAKVAIVAVLALGGAALAHAGAGGLTRLLGGLALVTLGAFSPWLLLRLIPLAEVASAAVGHIRGHVHATASIRTPEAVLASKTAEHTFGRSNGHAGQAADGIVVHDLLEQMHRRAQAAENGASTATAPPSSPTPGGEAAHAENGDAGRAGAVSEQAESGIGAAPPRTTAEAIAVAPQRVESEPALPDPNGDGHAIGRRPDTTGPTSQADGAGDSPTIRPIPPADPQGGRLLGDGEQKS